MMRKLLILAALFGFSAQAEVLNMPSPGQATQTPAAGAQHVAPSVDRSHLPRRGTLMKSVRARHGEPLSIAGPVGDPPITRWVYPDFIVFFEYQHVINAVIPGKPPAIHHQDELRSGVPR